MLSLFILAAVSAALCYGVGDFIGGKASAKIPLVQVLVIGEVVGACMFGLLAWLNHEATMPFNLVGIAVCAGIAGAFGLAALYHGISQGYTAITAPVSAVISAIIPILYGMYISGLPSTLTLCGMLLGIIAIVLNSIAGRASGYHGLWQGLSAGIAIGIFLVLLKFIGSAGIYTPLAIARAGSLIITIPWLLFRPGSKPSGTGVALAIMAGTFDLIANAAYMISTQLGRLDIASMLASLYPAVTVILAFFLNGEKLSPLQRWGLVTTIIASALIAF